MGEREWMLATEAVPIRLMATIWADAEAGHDDLATPQDLTAWLGAVGAVEHDSRRVATATVTAAELALARRLRDAVRRLAAQVTGDDRASVHFGACDGLAVEDAVRDVNEALTHLPAPRITLTADGRLQQDFTGGDCAVLAALARIAKESIALLTGPQADKLRACYAPGCVLYFVKTHPRREWCSVTCGNRVRAARHYDKVRSAR